MARNNQRDMANDIIGLVREGTKRWTRTRKTEERNPASRSYRMSRMTQERGVSFKEAASQIMESAYMQASGDGALPANARQIMYAARGHIQKEPRRRRLPRRFPPPLDGTRGNVYIIHTMQSREIIKRLTADSWRKVAQKGSHVQFKHPTKPGRVTVPHPKRDIPTGTLRSIEKQCGLKLRG
jgi:predicted RNA binding protein YcfA (HicA-like mRNA interferase family)